MKECINLGIVGVGNIGTKHLTDIINGECPNIRVGAVADINSDRLSWVKENISEDIKLFSNAEEMFDSGLIDSVLVATPHYEHPQYAIEAFKRKLNVLIEKPAGVYTKQVIEMNEMADKTDVVFGIMFNQRTDHNYRKMKEIVDSGRLGEIRRTNWIITDWYRTEAYFNSGGWRATWAGEGGGVLLNQCPHNLDLWQWICGMPSKVSTHMKFGKWHNIEVEDDVTTYVEYPNGATGVFITSTGDVPGTNRFEILFDKGKLIQENGKLHLWELEVSEPEWRITCQKPFAVPEMTEIEVETDGQSTQHIGVLNSFADAILFNKPLIADGREGINGLAISNAMHLSAFLNKEIELPSDNDLFYNELMKKVNNSKIKENVVQVVSDTEGTYGKQ